MKYLILLIISLSAVQLAQGQTIILERSVEDTTNLNYGANANLYLGGIFSYSMFVNHHPDILKMKLFSGEITMGYYYKIKHSNLFSSNFNVLFNSTNYEFFQNSAKIFPDSHIHDNQTLHINSLGAEYGLRVNIDPDRGNVLGKYISFNAGINWLMSTRVISKDLKADGTRVKQISKRLPYKRNFMPYLGAVLGIETIQLFVKIYQTEPIEDNISNAPIFPKLLLGIRIAS